MSRRPGNPARRLAEGGSLPFVGSGHSKSRSGIPLLDKQMQFKLFVFHCLVGSVVDELGAILLIVYCCSGSGGHISEREAFSKLEGSGSCALEVQGAIPILKKTYGDSMRKVLHLGPDTCSVVLKLLKEEETEAWGVEPYDLDDVDANCKNLVRKGIMRWITCLLDISTKLSELARVSSGGVVIFSGYPGQRKAKVAELSKFGRPATSLEYHLYAIKITFAPGL
ncbi:hypothetical protein GH714_008571 [Hevea brasiliensis]|uniref:Uncharacterized protein n=1 Tax=Hevea brasiliensis TaxID=3981 RepID=A0A6A6L1T8_HEVBR|nr:hypothetical protein GH714_008571 [Hevea brasiliensis]